MRKRYPAESVVIADEKSGRSLRQVTTAPAIHHQPFFIVPAYDDDDKHLTFVSHRTGRPEIFIEERATGDLVQLTEQAGVNEWSVHPSHDGRHVYFTASSAGYRVEVASGDVERVADFGPASFKGAGMVAGGMGTTALSRDDRWWALRMNDEHGANLVVIDTDSGASATILKRDTIAHMQFCPDDPDLLFYAGPLKDRLWTIRRDGRENRSRYERRPGQWITHESWIPGRRELAFVDWPHGVRALDVTTEQCRTVAAFNAWHPITDRTGKRMVADTNFPDTGVYIFPVDGRSEERELVCESLSSNQGDHWAGPFPYEHGPINVNAPQHTHPHPSFSSDGTRIVFTSDRTGFAQVYEVELDGEARSPSG